MKTFTIAAVTGALLLTAAAPAQAHTINVNAARAAASDLAREVYFMGDSVDYRTGYCARQSLHRVSCLGINEYASGLQCWARVTVQLSRTSYRRSISYGRAECN